MKIKRDAFLYLDSKDPRFAQCGTCIFGPSACSIMSGISVDAKTGSCGFYIGGSRRIHERLASLTKRQTGYVERQVRCENCKFSAPGRYGNHTCLLYRTLNKDHPGLFDLDEEIESLGCCNAQVPS